MVEAIVFVVMEQLASIIRLEQEVRQVVGVRKKISKLSSTLGIIKAVLDDAEKKQFSNKAVKIWMARLKDIMYDADDVLDEWYTSILISTQSQTKGATTNKVLSFFSSPCSCFHPVVFRRDFALRIKDIRARLDDVARDKEQLNLIQSQSYHQDNRPRQLTSSIVDVSEVQGRELDKGIIQSKVLGEKSHQEIHAHVPVISIVGMGGLGKTTLAQLVFKEEKVKTAFQLKIWVCVSEPFDRERLAKEITEQASGGNLQNVVGWEVLHQRLCSSVNGKRFLLVLDDVWTENSMVWTQLKLSLDGGAPGSRIIITTRNKKVAKMVGSSYIHTLKALSEDQCWSLFRHIAFQGRSQEDIERLEEIGMEISNKCKGIPLAAKIAANLMRLKQTKLEWRSVLQSDIWELQLEKEFFPALLLSYHSLPAHLKQCFMYTAIFPKDSILEKDELVKLWMAQGLTGSDGGKELEIVAGDYFDDLAMRSFFQDFKKDEDGNVTSCKMHDFIHDLAQSLTKDECLITEMKDAGLTYNKIRHLNALYTESFSSFTAKNLHTLMLKAPMSTQILRETFLQSTCLRALDLHGSALIELPDEVQCLLHLRYLNLSQTKLRILPQALCNLYNLQTLKLNNCKELHELPEGIGGLSNLRHLEVKDTDELEYTPQSIGRMSHLRTLDKFIVSGSSKGSKVGELRDLNFLIGRLDMRGLRQVEYMDESKGAEMLKKKGLGFLRLEFGYSREEQVAIEEDEVKRLEGVLEGLQPNTNLEGLEIVQYPGLAFPFWMTSKSLLGNVVSLELQACQKCTQLPALGNMKSLEHLRIGALKSVKHIGAEFYGEGGEASFPKLKVLSLDNLQELDDWEILFSRFRKVMPRLCHLFLSWCPKLTRLPALGRLESLENIEIKGLKSLKAVGTEFLGISSGDGGDQESNATLAFPCLRKLKFSQMEEWEEWNLPLFLFHQLKETIMQHLSELRISYCQNLRALPAALGILPSLQWVELEHLDALKRVGAEFVQILDSGVSLMLFPKLIKLTLWCFPEWMDDQYEEIEAVVATIMPCLQKLHIGWCPQLKVLPSFIFSHSLTSVVLHFCPQLMDIPCLPRLPLRSDQDDLGHFPMLDVVEVFQCPALTERCIREDWRNTLSSHIAYTFQIDGIEIKGTKRHSSAWANEGVLGKHHI